ncbi:hypothetical protein HDU98_006240 [Podochytrium sp. JEL0797]|nr:hypothetical protein HDU98_006240 [Podochytrium sp. JEL0797]
MLSAEPTAPPTHGCIPTIPLSLEANGSSSAFTDLNTLRSDTSFADVLLLLGDSQTPVLAHAAILSLKCDYYKKALEDRWVTSTAIPDGIPVDAKKSLRAVLSHPDFDADTMTAVLEFIYTNQVCIPEPLLTRVALCADHLLLEDLKTQCLEFLVHQCLTPSNAIDVYSVCDKLNWEEGKRSALVAVRTDLDASIAAGRDHLLNTRASALYEMLTFDQFHPQERWRVMMAWVKLRQGSVDLSLEAGLDTGFDTDQGHNELKPLLPLVIGSLFSVSDLAYRYHVAPFSALLGDLVRDALVAHFNARLVVSVHEWAVDGELGSKILDPKALEALMAKLRAKVKAITPTRANLLFRGTMAGFQNAAFHDACDGRMHTLTIVKAKGGVIVGGYAAPAWKSEGVSGWIPDAFLFRVNGVTKTFETLGCGKSGDTYPCAGCGPVFGNGFVVDERNFTMLRQGAEFEPDEMEEYEVYQLQ